MPAYHSVSGSLAEDLFIELFSDVFGAENAGYLYSQYHLDSFKDNNFNYLILRCFILSSWGVV